MMKFSLLAIGVLLVEQTWSQITWSLDAESFSANLTKSTKGLAATLVGFGEMSTSTIEAARVKGGLMFSDSSAMTSTSPRVTIFWLGRLSFGSSQ